MAALCREIIQLTEEFETKHLKKEDWNDCENRERGKFIWGTFV
jgi:hypothetical protein